MKRVKLSVSIYETLHMAISFKQLDMDLSVILCTWNNAPRLDITLDALCACIVPIGLRWELVVVNNNCTDKTDEIVTKYKDRLPINYIHEPEQGLSYARNTGLNTARGELIIFTDDDVRPFPGWLQAYWLAYRERGSGFYYGGPIESEFEGAPPDAELLRYAPTCVQGLSYGNEPKQLDGHGYFMAANWACSRNEILRAGGFDPSLGLDPSTGRLRTGEETALMDALKQQGLHPFYLPEAKLYHFVPREKTTLSHIGRKIEAIAASEEGFKNKNGDLPAKRGIHLWMFRILLKRYCQYILARTRGGAGYGEYIEFMRWRGVVKYHHKGL